MNLNRSGLLGYLCRGARSLDVCHFTAQLLHLHLLQVTENRSRISQCRMILVRLAFKTRFLLFSTSVLELGVHFRQGPHLPAAPGALSGGLPTNRSWGTPGKGESPGKPHAVMH